MWSDAKFSVEISELCLWGGSSKLRREFCVYFSSSLRRQLVIFLFFLLLLEVVVFFPVESR